MVHRPVGSLRFGCFIFIALMKALDVSEAFVVAVSSSISSFRTRTNVKSSSFSSFGNSGERKEQPNIPNDHDGSWSSFVSTQADSAAALASLLEEQAATKQPASLAFLFIGTYHAKAFESLVQVASQRFPTLVSMITGGVIADGVEYDEPSVPCMTLMCGAVPDIIREEDGLQWFQYNELHCPPPNGDDPYWKQLRDRGKESSFLLFADPWSPLQSVLSGMRGLSIVGGVSVPTGAGPTVAINDRPLPQGSLVCLEWPGEIQIVVAQGCRPVGDRFTVTAVKGNTIVEMDGRPAVDVWNEVLQGIQSPSARSSAVCGIRVDRTSSHPAQTMDQEDYLIRQIVGLSTTSGLVIAGGVRIGDIVRFHIRDASAARKDLDLMISRAAAGRLWRAPPILATLQISCVARGRFLFGSSNIDTEETTKLSGGTAAVGGFFANGELGPVGLSGFSDGDETTDTFLHGFTTVVALLCRKQTSGRNDANDDATALAVQNDAWG